MLPWLLKCNGIFDSFYESIVYLSVCIPFLSISAFLNMTRFNRKKNSEFDCSLYWHILRCPLHVSAS
jgi:NADH:ubiquinone oxidoreductase subunit 3 (subunit A)